MNAIGKVMGKDFLQGKGLKRTIFCLGILVVALCIFQMGIFVGFHKASYSYHMGDNYYRAFGEGPRSGGSYSVGVGKMGNNFPDSHGAFGEIIKIDLPTLVIEDTQGVEKVIVLKDTTIIKKIRSIVQKEALKTKDLITVIGSPNTDSQIEAKFIRVLPAPTDSFVKQPASSKIKTTN